MIWTSSTLSRVPAGERVYAIGDIHGRLDLLDELLWMIRHDDAERAPVERRRIVFLGDYIDRGANSRGVVARLIAGPPEGFEAIHLKGNHEDMMLRAPAEPDVMALWLGNGGTATLSSYGIDWNQELGAFADYARLGESMAQALPAEHVSFLRGLKLYLEIGDYFFVHAGVKPGLPLERQTEEDCLYIREPFLSHRGSFGKVVVHGHTPVQSPDIRANRIGIDTGAQFTGRLTALRLEADSRGFLAT